MNCLLSPTLSHITHFMNWLLLPLCILQWTFPIAAAAAGYAPPLIPPSSHTVGYHFHARSSPLLASMLATDTATSSKSLDESLLLLSFKSSITEDPSGALNTWRNESSPCSWQGITCSSDGFVSSVNLTSLQLSGSFSMDSLSNLPHLTSLDLSNNFLTGPLPPSFCNPNTHNLIELNLVNNHFSGPIPAALSNCTSLVTISLYSNSLSGPIPPELGALSNLEYLALSFNQLNGTIPISILTNCTKLTTLALSLNEFSGPLPSEIGKLTSLKDLWLDSNYFSGSIPPELGNLTQLELLQLDTNNLTGMIPSSLGQLTSLTKLLSLSINQLTGPIPPQLGGLSKLNILTLKGNSLNGTIPEELGNMQAIQGLFLEENQFEGRIPAELANCTNLQQLRLNSNRLTGPIPDVFTSLQQLTQVYVHNNLLQGPIPTSLANLKSLQDLSLGYNALDGPIPPALASFPTMAFNFSMPHNHLNGSIPSSLGLMIHVQNIDLSANNLRGKIPANLGECLGMALLNLSHNSLTGEIPESFAQLQLLQLLDLSSNSLSGGIPSFLANLTELQYMNFSNNNFTGPIPSSGVFARMNATSFLNNPGLCGPPLPNSCPLATTTPPSSQEGRSLAVRFKILITILSFLLVCTVLLLVMCFRRRSKKATIAALPNGLTSEASQYSKNFRQFTAKELEIATHNFSDARLIGIGGASKVYRATNLIIRLALKMEQVNAAVKVLSIDHNRHIFSTELKALGSLRHRNLVKLYGFCVNSNLHAFVLELLPNGSLEDRLYEPQAQNLSIKEKLSIALDVAHGLAYLHHGLRRPIVHRDVKPSNILFDEGMVARVADFGIAEILNQDEVFSKASGTLGYIAPEYAESTTVGTKGDVYSFGIVMLEMLTKKRPTDAMFGSVEVSLPVWVREAYPERTMCILDAAPPELVADEDEEAVKAMVKVALSCTETRPDNRPDMETVVQKLTDIASSLSSSAPSQRKSSLDHKVTDVLIKEKQALV